MKPNSAPSIQQAFESYQQTRPSAELWVGETAAAWDSGKPGVTNAFVDGFWFVTQLGSLAQLGVHTQCRQALVGGAYELIDKHTFRPNPDYYIALLHSRVMGRAVLDVTQPASHPLVRVYAHCSAYNQSATAPGAVAVAIINADTKQTVQLSDLGLGHTAPRREWRLRGAKGDVLSRSVEVNGQQLDGAEIPEPLLVTQPAPVTLRPSEILFAVFPGADAQSCR